MREIICIHTGQAGVQLSSTAWEILCIEHGVQADGNLSDLLSYDDNYSFQSFFQEVPTGQFVPRAISIDLEPSVLDEIRSGPYRKLFHPDQLISGFEDAANNYARGHFTLGKEKIDYTMNRIRKVADMCENLQGFFLLNSYGGGTGSGFTSLLLERLNVEFTKKTAFQVSVFPSDKLSSATVEPYNTMLCTTAGIDNADLCNFFDNESSYNICCRNLEIARPTYSNINRVIAQIFSSMTVSVRFEGCLNADLDQVITNLVPFPRLHFPVFSHAPILSNHKASHQGMSVGELTTLAFDPSNQLVNIVMAEGKYMCCCLQYRGNIKPKEVNDALFEVKRRADLKFVDWCPTAFKLGINSQPPVFIPRSEIAQTDRCVTLLTNSSAISQKFLNLADKFDILFNKRCFLHWYVGEGMEEMEFSAARESMSIIVSDYFELGESDDEEPPVAGQSIVQNKEENKNKPNEVTEAEEGETTEKVEDEVDADADANKKKQAGSNDSAEENKLESVVQKDE